MMPERSDEQLMAAFQVGDAATLELLVQRHHHRLLGYLYRFVGGDRPLAEDLTQETFLQVIRHCADPIDRSFKAWLYTIATNLARDYQISYPTANVLLPAGERTDRVVNAGIGVVISMRFP